MLITELRGNPTVFTLADKKTTLRLMARSTVKIAKDSISQEMILAETMGFISITEESKDVKNKVVKEQEKEQVQEVNK